MKHTELYNEYKKLDELERQELKAAVKAHGGEYIFVHVDENGNYDDDELLYDAPIVSAATSSMPEYADFYISSVSVDKNGHLSIYGLLKEYAWDEVELEDIAHAQLGFITDLIPSTPDVFDVSITQPEDEKPVVVLSREDVERVGYDPDMTDKQFEGLWAAMIRAFEWNSDFYWSALRQACEDFGLKPLKLLDSDEEA